VTLVEIKEIKPCVVGLGKLGLPLAAVIAEAGFVTFGIDKDKSLIASLLDNSFKSPEPNLDSTIDRSIKNLKFVDNVEVTKDCNIFFLIVPTPSLVNGRFDNQYLIHAISDLLDSWVGLSGEKSLVIVSTVMPRTCVEVFLPLIRSWEFENQSKLKVNLLYSPEFIALGSVIYNLKHPDMTLIGCESISDSASFLQIMEKVTIGKPRTQILNLTEAEIVKLMVNCFVTMKISFANFIGEISNILPGTNKYKISDALGMDTRIGGKYLRPGLGFAGPCFPRDNRALIAFSEENGLKASLGLATDEINKRQPDNVLKIFKQNFPDAKSVAVVGVTYKPHSKVIEESQTLLIANLLKDRNFEVSLYDPLLDDSELPGYKFCASIAELKNFDVLIVSKEFEYSISEVKWDEKNILII
jgi:UDPglucose 6-dehydrogenase